MFNYIDYYSFQKNIFMEKEIDFKSLSLKEYRDRFGKDLSLDVLKRAYDYSQNGHSPRPALSTSSILYAEPFKQRELFYAGLMAEFEPNAVTIWRLQTETATAQRALLRGLWDYHNRADCIARLGENYNCTLQKTLEFPNTEVFGFYQHYHRFVAVAGIKFNPECESDFAPSTVRLIINGIAVVIATNAVAYYPEYLDQERQWHHEHDKKTQKSPKLPEFKEFLLKQPLLRVKGIASFFRSSRIPTVGEYLAQSGDEIKQKLILASVNVFG